MITNVNFPDGGDHAELVILIPRRPDGSHNIAAAFAALDRALSVKPEAYAPAIALADGESATGGGMATHHVEPGPDLPPAVEAYLETQADELPFRNPEAPVGDGEVPPCAS